MLNATGEVFEGVSLRDRESELAEAAASFSPEGYNEFRRGLGPKESLYCDLLRIKEKGQEAASLLSDSKKAKLAERYSETLSLLWESPEENDDDIERLSGALFEINCTLPDGKEIRPQFSNKTFTADGDAPGNFSFCYMDNMTFISVQFSNWEEHKLQGTTFVNCVFGEGTLCSTDNFKLVHRASNCSFEEPFSEIDGFDSNDKGLIDDVNSKLVSLVLEPAKEIRKLGQENKALKQQNEALRAQLRQLLQIAPQASSSTSRFFDSRDDDTLDEKSSTKEKSLHR